MLPLVHQNSLRHSNRNFVGNPRIKSVAHTRAADRYRDQIETCLEEALTMNYSDEEFNEDLNAYEATKRKWYCSGVGYNEDYIEDDLDDRMSEKDVQHNTYRGAYQAPREYTLEHYLDEMAEFDRLLDDPYP